MSINVSIVLGLGFGDEGKGAHVNHLCGQAKNPLVVRFNGGHQVGHTVVLDGKRHPFSNFGSGTLQGTPTYWSEFCTVSPMGVRKEGDVLRKLGVEPKLIFNANAMVTTPFDVLMNYKLEELNMHGSVGVGFGQTIQRNEDHYHLYIRDLYYPKIRDLKLKNIINKYYGYNFDPTKPNQNAKTRKLYDDFIGACDELMQRYGMVEDMGEVRDLDLIFEGGQGIMLDTDYGFFPHVTRSNCVARNAITLLNSLEIEYKLHTYYITRAYQTRHGNGPMTNEDLDNDYIIDNPNETNTNAGMQGAFRKTVLDLDLLKYAVSCDVYENPESKRTLVVTCLDQVPAQIPVTRGGKLVEMTWKEIPKYVGFRDAMGTWSDEGYKFPWDKSLKTHNNEILDSKD